MRTSELVGHDLNVAVHKALNIGTPWRYYGQAVPNYCNEWKDGGPIIERVKMDIQWVGEDNCRACIDWLDEQYAEAFGPTPLIAAMRGFVASKLGSDVTTKKEDRA
jgi:hypothetical protein